MAIADLYADSDSTTAACSILKESGRPDPGAVATVLKTAGYQCLFQIGREPGAARPCSAEEISECFASAETWAEGEQPLLTREYFWGWAKRNATALDDWAAHFAKHPELSGCVDERLSLFLPDGAAIGRVTVYSIVRGCGGGTALPTGDKVLLDAPDPAAFGQERLIAILTHELIHLYQYKRIEDYNWTARLGEPERFVFDEIIRPIAMEGGAGLVGDAQKLQEEAKTPEQLAFVELALLFWLPLEPNRYDAVLNQLSSVIEQALEGEKAVVVLRQEVDELISRENRTHGAGMHMARLIENTLGREALRESQVPLSFFENYQEAAQSAPDAYAFPDRVMRLLRERYC